MANVFISHRRTDTVEAERLARDIQSAGHNVWLDEWEISLGDSITAKMNDGLREGTFVILCLSGAGVESPWMSREWLSALARQLNGERVKLLPVRLTGRDIPPVIADLKYADAMQDYPTALAELLKVIT